MNDNEAFINHIGQLSTLLVRRKPRFVIISLRMLGTLARVCIRLGVRVPISPLNLILLRDQLKVYRVAAQNSLSTSVFLPALLIDKL